MDNLEHQVDIHKVKILAVEPRKFEGVVRQAIHIRIEQASLNRGGVITPSRYLEQCVETVKAHRRHH